MLILPKYGHCLQVCICNSPGTFISPGSEFCSVDILEPLLLHHHNWPKIKHILTEGSSWPLLPITEEDCIAKNKEFTVHGNPKPAVKYESELLKMILSKVNQGWMIPLPISCINNLKHGESAPVGVDDKVWVELEVGSKKTKFRLTHDQSFKASLGTSVNKRTDKEKLHPLFHGGCLSRLIHYIISLRSHCPGVPILGGKSDFKAAYQRLNLHGTTAPKCSIFFKQFALSSL